MGGQGLGIPGCRRRVEDPAEVREGFEDRAGDLDLEFSCTPVGELLSDLRSAGKSTLSVTVAGPDDQPEWGVVVVNGRKETEMLMLAVSVLFRHDDPAMQPGEAVAFEFGNGRGA